MRIERYRKTRYWAVRDAAGTLVCLCMYRKGAREVVKQLSRGRTGTALLRTGKRSNVL
jgi:hypothetical protein